MMKNIIFDVDDTLYDLMEPFERAHKELFAGDTDVECEELFKLSRVYSDEAFYMAREGKISPEEEFAYRIIKSYGDVQVEVDREQAKKFEERYRYYQNHIHVPKKMQDLLTLCREQELPMGVLTNGTEKNQGKKLRTLELERWFSKENMFISDVIGATKPDIRAFGAVLEKMHLKPEDTWFIGDTFEVDVVGAKNAGWHVIWFNHRRRSKPEGMAEADIEVSTLEELRNEIQKIVGK